MPFRYLLILTFCLLGRSWPLAVQGERATLSLNLTQLQEQKQQLQVQAAGAGRRGAGRGEERAVAAAATARWRLAARGLDGAALDAEVLAISGLDVAAALLPPTAHRGAGKGRNQEGGGGAQHDHGGSLDSVISNVGQYV